MALIACSECSKEISDKAATCPGCGAPVAAQPAQEPEPVVTIQATGKSFKGWQAIGVVCVTIGAILLFTDSTAMGLALCIVGSITYLAATFGGWWRHG